MTPKQLTCLRCGHQWWTRPETQTTDGDLPAACPKCRNVYWNIPRGTNPPGRPRKNTMTTMIVTSSPMAPFVDDQILADMAEAKRKGGTGCYAGLREPAKGETFLGPAPEPQQVEPRLKGDGKKVLKVGKA